jgi:hypothetical protein
VTTGNDRLPRRRADVELHEDGAQTRLFSPGSGGAHELNPTARAIWELCDGTVTVAELVDAIRQVFNVPAATARGDVEAVIDQLEAADLVTWAGVD